MDTNYIIETKNLTKQYGSQKSVADLNIHVKRGRIYGLLGRNGAGKTTTMKMLLGLTKPTSGEVKIWGKSLQGNEKKLLPRIGSLIESPGFYPNLTGTENLRIFATLRGVPNNHAIKDALDLVGLPYKDKKLFSQYSLGMKQRLAIALAVMHDPELLILDEPINGLDPIGIAEVRSFIRELCDTRGKTILISSHILSEISLLADDIGIIDHGALLEEESLAELEQKSSKHIRFTISDTAEVQKVKMEDEVPVARLLVNKKGEFLDSVSLLDNAKGMIEHLFNYVTGNLTDVTFNVYAAEAIRAADGVSADYYAADELVGSITTDGNGIAQMDNLPLGRYYIVEKETAHGYVLDNEPRYVDLTYRDQDTPLVTYSADWQNARQRIQVEVLKKEKDSDKVLSGAIFGLYAADDIVSSKGKVLLAKDTLIELKTTDEDGKIQFVADLPVDSRYYIKELAAPDGYVTDQEPQEFTFEYQGSGTSVAEYAFTFEDEQTTVELSKADLTDKKELPGASLKVTDEDGNTVDEWVSKEEAHIIKGLIVGKKYKMTETKPADGYVTAESIEFTVENTKEVQKHQMLDDVTKVEISKKDITDSSEVPGAKLIILDKDGKKVESWTSTDKPHMVEKLPVGEYTLREEQAPDGYLIAEDVKFTVKDTGKVQKVKMKDAHPYGKLVIKKTDSTSKAALSGAEFELREKESGKVVEKLVTDKTGTATSGKLPIATYKNGKVEKTVEYILVETKAPNGYELSSKKEEIRFEYKDGKTKVIEIVKEIKNTKSPSGSTPTGNSPKTGDSTNIWLPILLAVLSACGIGGVIWYKKKKGN